jgi:hypothetical protein
MQLSKLLTTRYVRGSDWESDVHDLVLLPHSPVLLAHTPRIFFMWLEVGRKARTANTGIPN